MTAVSSPLFRHGHAAHPDWRVALAQSLSQIDGQSKQSGYSAKSTLGLMYIADAFAPYASEILTTLKLKTGVPHWAGGTGIGVFAGGVEYLDEPAISLLLLDLPVGGAQVFNGIARSPQLTARSEDGALLAHTALVHADPHTPEIEGLISDLSQRTHTGYLFGGLMSSRQDSPQFANQTLTGGLSGVMFASNVDVRVRVTQGCHPIGPSRIVTRCDGNWLLELDGKPAFDALRADLRLPLDRLPTGELLRTKLKGGLFAGIASGAASDRTARFSDYIVRGVVGIDPGKGSLAVAGRVDEGAQLAFCKRDADAARADLIRIVTELRESLEEDGVTPRGAVYVSCLGRGAQLFGEPGVELKTIAHHLGEIPLAGFAANGEIARDKLYGFTGVLAVFA
ncbi:MAG: FIST signal transduction protein [Burkholderiaceae bacterium]